MSDEKFVADNAANQIEVLLDDILDGQDVKSVEIRRYDDENSGREYMGIARIDRGGFSKAYGRTVEQMLVNLKEKA